MSKGRSRGQWSSHANTPKCDAVNLRAKSAASMLQWAQKLTFVLSFNNLGHHVSSFFTMWNWMLRGLTSYLLACSCNPTPGTDLNVRD